MLNVSLIRYELVKAEQRARWQEAARAWKARAATHDQAAALFELVMARYEKGAILLTSNTSFAQWGGLLGDEVLASALLGRLLHHAEVITINGPSYRMKDRLSKE